MGQAAIKSWVKLLYNLDQVEAMGGDHCHNSTRARFSYSGRAISYSGRAISYSGRAVSYSGRAISYLGGAISLQLRNSTLGKNVLLQLRYRHDIT